MGIVPIWGYQLIVAIVLSKLLRLNTALVIVAANISLPPMIPVIIYLSLLLGARILHIENAIPLTLDVSLGDIQLHLQQYLVGSTVLAVFAAAFFGGLTYLWFFFTKKSR